MQGDGIFLWYWAAGLEPTSWSKGFASVKEANQHAFGHCPHGDYTLIEADRAAIRVRPQALFEAAAILEGVFADNPGCWPEGMPSTSERERADLEAKLADCLDRWLRKHGFDGTTALCTIRSTEYFPDRRSKETSK